MTPPPSPPAHAAQAAARDGHWVIPVHPGSKVPAVDDWENWATRDPATITRKWSEADYGVGIACGPSRLLVVDLDTAHGQQPPTDWAGATCGADVLARLARTAGHHYPSHTYTVTTPSGGQHLYFRAPVGLGLRNTQGMLGWRIDTRGAGGYVVAAGSTGSSGIYQVINKQPIAPLPPWLIQALRPRPPSEPEASRAAVAEMSAYVAAALRYECRAVATAQPGTRHTTLLNAANALGSLVGADVLDSAEASRALHAAAAEAAAGHTGRDRFTVAEADRTIHDGLQRGARNPRPLSDRAN